MIEKVNPMHPDKLADRIAGAAVDLAYIMADNARIAVEVLVGHGDCYVIAETSVEYKKAYADGIRAIVRRIAPGAFPHVKVVSQDPMLQENQRHENIRCGDNGIFRGVPLTQEETQLAAVARQIYGLYPYDGKYILDGERLIICQSNAATQELQGLFPSADINPLGDWTGGFNVDTGGTNRKLGSDMAQSVTGGGLHGKDLTKADVALNIYTFLEAQRTGKTVELSCAIGDEVVSGRPYSYYRDMAGEYIQGLGGFEKFAEWGLF